MRSEVWMPEPIYLNMHLGCMLRNPPRLEFVV